MDQGITNNSPEFQAGVVQKKKKPVAAIIGIAAAVLVGGGAAAYAFVPVVHNTVNMAIMSNEKYSADVYKNNIEKANKDLKKSYSRVYDMCDFKKGVAGGMSLSGELDDSVLDEVKSQLQSDLFKEASIDVKETIKNGVFGGSVELSADSKRAIGADFVMDLNDKNIYLRVPELKEDYLKMPLDDYIKEADFEEEFDSIKNFDKLLLKPDDVEDLVSRYGNIIGDSLSEGAELQKGCEGKVGDVSYKYNKLVTKLDSKKGDKLGNKLAEELGNDKILKNYLVDNLGVSEEDYNDTIDDLKTDIDEAEEDVDSEDEGKFITYVDAEGTIRGFEITDDDDTQIMSYMIAKEGDSISGQISFEEESTVVINAKEDSGKYTGEMKINSDDQSASVSFENFEVIDGIYYNGTMSFDFTDVDSDIPVIPLTFESDGKSQKVSTEIDKVGKFTLTESKEDAEDIQIPDKSIDDPEEYMKDADIEKTLEDLCSSLGVNKDYASLLVQQLMGQSGLGNVNTDPDENLDPDDGWMSLEDPDNPDVTDPNNADPAVTDTAASDDDEVTVDYSFGNVKLDINGNPVALTNVDESLIPEANRAENVEGQKSESFYDDNMTMSVMVYNDTDAPLLPAQCKLASITIIDAAANAKLNGIGIGSTAADVAKAFGLSNVTDKTKSLYLDDPDDFLKYVYITFDKGTVDYFTVNCD